MRWLRKSCAPWPESVATYKARGIVLGRHNLGEADRIVAFFTLEHGKLRAVARGVRKTLSRQAGHIEPFSEVELMLAEGRNLDIVTSARLAWYPDNLTTDYPSLQLAYVMARMVERLTDDDHAAASVYKLLSYGLHWLNEHGASPALELFFKLRLMGDLGYRLRLENCVVCGRPLDSIYASPEHGGVVGAECRMGGEAELTANQLGLWRRLQAEGLEALAPGDDALALATTQICDTFYEYVFGRSFTAAA